MSGDRAGARWVEAVVGSLMAVFICGGLLVTYPKAAGIFAALLIVALFVLGSFMPKR